MSIYFYTGQISILICELDICPITTESDCEPCQVCVQNMRVLTATTVLQSWSQTKKNKNMIGTNNVNSIPTVGRDNNAPNSCDKKKIQNKKYSGQKGRVS